MRSNGGLNGGRVIKPYDVVQIRDIKSCNMVVGGESKVCKPPVLGDVGAENGK
jgi:hypothetical protein